MDKKILSIFLNIAIVVVLLILGGLFYFSNEVEWLQISPYSTANPPSEDRVILLTDQDFQEYPLLKQLFESRARIPISDNLFVTLKPHDPPCVSSEEADKVISRYGWPAQLKYLSYNDSYYVLNAIVT